MRKFLFLILVFMTSLYYQTQNLHAEESEVEISMQNYFEYLKSGDTKSILNLLTEPLFSERRKLLEENTEYPEFLKETYRNAYMVIKNIEKIDGDKRGVDVEIYFSDQEPPLKTRFILKRENGSWKISEEINT